MIIVYYVRGCREGEVDGAVCSRASVSREASSTYIKIFIYSLSRCMYSRNLPIGAAYKFLRMPPDSVPPYSFAFCHFGLLGSQTQGASLCGPDYIVQESLCYYTRRLFSISRLSSIHRDPNYVIYYWMSIISVP